MMGEGDRYASCKTDFERCAGPRALTLRELPPSRSEAAAQLDGPHSPEGDESPSRGCPHERSESDLAAALPSPRESTQPGEAGAEEEKGGGLWDNCPYWLGELNRPGSDR